jgi:hypothetical protein
MLHLPNVTLLGVDCVDLKRLQIAADISCKDITFGSVKLLSSLQSDDTRVISIPHISSTEQYSDFMIKDLHKYVETEYVLIFQYDGFVLNADGWSDEFLKYDYIGAPWYHLGDLRVGNGGFSLRSKKLVEWLAHYYSKVGVRIHPEDVFISKFARPLLEESGMRFAPENVAEKFSKEGNEHSVCWNGEFGFHGIKYTDISRWLISHPEYTKELDHPLDDYAILMKKYPVYTGTVHTLRFKKYNLQNFKLLSTHKRNYEIRRIQEKYVDLSQVKIGDIVVFKRSGVSFQDFPVPAFERKITKVEVFDSLKNLRFNYPKLFIAPPYDLIPKRMRIFAKYFPSFFLKENTKYAVFWF